MSRAASICSTTVLLAAASLLAVVTWGHRAPEPAQADPAVTAFHEPTVAANDVFELTLAQEADYGVQGNFFDVDIKATFQPPTPGAATTVGGFYYDTLADGTSLWKVRFVPTEVGHWRYAWRRTHTPTATQHEGSGAFDVTPATSPGFLRLNPEDAFLFLLADGSAFPAIGFNDCIGRRASMSMDGGDRFGAFSGASRTDQYLEAYGQAGFDMFRFSQANCSINLTDASFQHYDKDVAVFFDWLMAALRGHGFRVFYGIFGTILPASFPDPPPPEAERFLSYTVNRWAAYVHVWELYNERDAPDAWLTALADLVRAKDPYRHPISTSNPRPQLAAIDVNSPHWYGTESALQSDSVTAGNAKSWKGAGKPVVVGEQGNSTPQGDQWGNWLPESGLRMRLRSWTAFFNEISLLFWNNSWATNGSGGGAANLYLGSEERQYVEILQWFARAVDRPDLRPAPASTVSGYDNRAVRAYAVASADGVAVYLHHFADHSSVVTDGEITLDVPAAGTGRWTDPATGRQLAVVPVDAGANTLSVPAFTVDVAFFTTAGTDRRLPPLALAVIHNPQADGDLDADGLPDRGPDEPPFGMPPLELELDATSSYDPDGGPVATLWHFGDGSPNATSPVARHTYADGNWLTTLTVTDDEGSSASYSFMVRATADPNPDQNDPPLLNPLADVTAREGQLVLVSPSGADRELDGGSYHVDGHTVESLAFHAVDLPPGAKFEAPAGQGAPQLWWVPSFEQAGVYVVEFWVTDPEGASSVHQQVTITVLDVPQAGPPATPAPSATLQAPAGGVIYLPWTQA